MVVLLLLCDDERQALIDKCQSCVRLCSLTLSVVGGTSVVCP